MGYAVTKNTVAVSFSFSRRTLLVAQLQIAKLRAWTLVPPACLVCEWVCSLRFTWACCDVCRCMRPAPPKCCNNKRKKAPHGTHAELIKSWLLHSVTPRKTLVYPKVSGICLCTSFVAADPDSCTWLPWMETRAACRHQRIRCFLRCSNRMGRYWTRTMRGKRAKEHRRNRRMSECGGVQVTLTACAHWESHSLPRNREVGTQLNRSRIVPAVLASWTQSSQAFVILRKPHFRIGRLFWNHHENQRHSERGRPCLSFTG
jgi:hypothetical protein